MRREVASVKTSESNNEKENTVSFIVPKQNNIDRSQVLNDFNLVNNVYIFRLLEDL
jgi:hypothetical protein